MTPEAGKGAASGMPPADSYAGLTRQVLRYGEAFAAIVATAKSGGELDWSVMEALVDTAAWSRQGVFLGAKAEVLDWATYRGYVSAYAAHTRWEGRLRHVTEQGRRVILELEEHNTVGDHEDVSNTVTVYDFDEAGKLVHLDVYVMPLP